MAPVAATKSRRTVRCPHVRNEYGAYFLYKEKRLMTQTYFLGGGGEIRTLAPGFPRLMI